MASKGTTCSQIDVVVVGAGLAGLYALHQLRSRGLSVRVFEAGSGVGGTWFWNRYPGARCDVESVDYSYSFSEELQQEWTWTERYASQGEILRYIEHVADRFDLRSQITFDTRVESAHFDPAGQCWAVRTDAGEQLAATFCVMATGSLSTAQVPAIPGLSEFLGSWHHTAQWPHDDEPDFRGQRVGVIGTGSTGIQLIPQLAARADSLTVFQRTANFSMPAHNDPLDDTEMSIVKASYAERRREARRTRRGFPLPVDVTPESALAFSAEERLARYERMWRHGGAIFTATFGDLTLSHEANATAAEFIRAKIRGIVQDRRTADLLCPQDHPLGSKRPCVDTDYYQTFNRSNVSLVDLRASPIEAITPTGVRTAAGHVELDCLVFATGFDAITGTLNRIDIRGRDGVLLREHWQHGPRAYLGLCSAGFPNLFLVTGPGSPSVLCNMVVSIEQHVDLMTEIIDHMTQHELTQVEPTSSAEAHWVDHVNDIANGTLLVEGNSWYVGANIPGKPRRFMPYAGGMAAFIAECEALISRGYAGFEFSRASGACPDRLAMVAMQ